MIYLSHNVYYVYFDVNFVVVISHFFIALSIVVCLYRTKTITCEYIINDSMQ